MKLFNGKPYNVIRTVIFIALAIFVIISLHGYNHLERFETEYLRYFIGSLMIFYGAEEIVCTAFNDKKHYSIKTLYWNLVEILIGIVMIVFVENGEPDVTYAVVCVSWATWSILRETRELVEATLEFKKKATSLINILESLLVIGLSVTMIIEPTKHHAGIHLCLLVLELLTKALLPIIDNACKPFMERLNKRTAPLGEDGEEADKNACKEDEAAAADGDEEIMESSGDPKASDGEDGDENKDGVLL